MVLTSASDVSLFWFLIFEAMFSKRVVVDVLVEVNCITQSASLLIEKRMTTVILSLLVARGASQCGSSARRLHSRISLEELKHR